MTHAFHREQEQAHYSRSSKIDRKEIGVREQAGQLTILNGVITLNRIEQGFSIANKEAEIAGVMERLASLTPEELLEEVSGWLDDAENLVHEVKIVFAHFYQLIQKLDLPEVTTGHVLTPFEKTAGRLQDRLGKLQSELFRQAMHIKAALAGPEADTTNLNDRLKAILSMLTILGLLISFANSPKNKDRSGENPVLSAFVENLNAMAQQGFNLNSLVQLAEQLSINSAALSGMFGADLPAHEEEFAGEFDHPNHGLPALFLPDGSLVRTFGDLRVFELELSTNNGFPRTEVVNGQVMYHVNGRTNRGEQDYLVKVKDWQNYQARLATEAEFMSDQQPEFSSNEPDAPEQAATFDLETIQHGEFTYNFPVSEAMTEFLRGDLPAGESFALTQYTITQDTDSLIAEMERIALEGGFQGDIDLVWWLNTSINHLRDQGLLVELTDETPNGDGALQQSTLLLTYDAATGLVNFVVRDELRTATHNPWTINSIYVFRADESGSNVTAHNINFNERNRELEEVTHITPSLYESVAQAARNQGYVGDFPVTTDVVIAKNANNRVHHVTFVNTPTPLTIYLVEEGTRAPVENGNGLFVLRTEVPSVYDPDERIFTFAPIGEEEPEFAPAPEPSTRPFVMHNGERIEVNNPFLINGEPRIGQMLTLEEIQASFRFDADSRIILESMETPDNPNIRTAYQAFSAVFVGYGGPYGLMEFAVSPDSSGEARIIYGVPFSAQAYKFDNNQNYIFGQEFNIDMTQNNFQETMFNNGLSIGDNIIIFAYAENDEQPELAENEILANTNSMNLDSNNQPVTTTEMLECFTTAGSTCDITNSYENNGQGAVLFYGMFLRR